MQKRTKTQQTVRPRAGSYRNVRNCASMYGNDQGRLLVRYVAWDSYLFGVAFGAKFQSGTRRILDCGFGISCKSLVIHFTLNIWHFQPAAGSRLLATSRPRARALYLLCPPTRFSRANGTDGVRCKAASPGPAGRKGISFFRVTFRVSL